MHNFFTKKNNKTSLSSKDDKRLQSIDLVETYTYGTIKNLLRMNDKGKCNNVIK